MAENVTLPGTGDVAAADDIAGVKHQRVKVSLGADGTAVDLNGDSTGGAWVQGAVAHDAADTGKPVKIGGVAYDLTDAPQTAVGPTDRVSAMFGLHGELTVAIVDPATGLAPTGASTVQGDVDAGGGDSGQPVKIGGRADTGTPTAVADGERQNQWYGPNGQTAVFQVDAAGNGVAVITTADGVANQIVLGSAAMGMFYNGTTWDRVRGDTSRGMYVASHLDQLNISQTPTVTNGAYAANDAVGGLLTFANAARFSGGSGLVQAVTILCKTPALLPALELVLFNQTFTAMSDNGTWSPSDADMLNCIGSIPIAAWSDATTNSIATRFGLGFPFTLTGTSLFGQLMTRTAVTPTSTSDIVIGVSVIRD